MDRPALMRCLRAKPFRPFRVWLNSGQHHIKHPEMIRVGPDFALVFRGAIPEGEIEDYTTIDLLFIEQVERRPAP